MSGDCAVGKFNHDGLTVNDVIIHFPDAACVRIVFAFEVVFVIFGGGFGDIFDICPDVCAPAFGVVEIDLAVGVHAVFFNRAVKETVFS